MAQTGDVHDLGLRNGCPSTPQITGDWYSGDMEVNPIDDATIATTGELQEGWYFIQMRVYASVDSIVELVKRNATNTSDVNAQRVACKEAIGNADFIGATKVFLNANERLIARMDGGVTGNVQASIFAANIIG